jgi:hypothetical protein
MFNKMKEWNHSPELQTQFKDVGQFISHVTKEQKIKFKSQRRHGTFMNTQNPDLEFL